MASKITSTDLKQNTRQILQQVEESGEPLVIYTYNQPKAVLVEYDEWEKSKNRVKTRDLQKYTFNFGIKDTTKFFRKMRDEESNS